MKKSMVSAAILLAGSWCGANAEGTLDFLHDYKMSDFYAGLLISNADVSGAEVLAQDLETFNATLGLVVHKGWSVEGRFGAGTDHADSVFQDPLASYFAGLLRYHYTWNDRIMTYAGIGYSTRSYSDLLTDVTESQSGVMATMGVNLFGSAKTAVNLEYLYFQGEESSSAIGLGFHHYFGKY